MGMLHLMSSGTTDFNSESGSITVAEEALPAFLAQESCVHHAA
jgi:hypothetical protein